MSLSPRIEEPNSEVKKLINVRTWATVSSLVNVVYFPVFEFVHVPLDGDIIGIKIWLWLWLWVYNKRCGRSKEVRTPELIGQRVRVSVRVTMLRFYGSSGRDSVGRGQNSSNRVSGISTRTMHQSTTPSLSQTIWPRWASRQFLTLPIFQILLPVTFGYSLSSDAVVMKQLRRWKRLWRRSLTRPHKRTSMGPSWSCWNGTTCVLQRWR